MDEVTLKTIADQLGISISTVSRALKDHPDIKRATKQKVLELAERLEYEPNSLAAQLLNRKSKTIGVVVPKILYPLYGQAITGIEAVVEKHGYQVIISQTQESYEKEVSQLKSLLAFRVSGVILSISAYTTNYEHLQKVISKRIPLVLFNRDCQEIACSKVLIDNHKAAYEAVEVLLKLGKKRIAYIGGPEYLQISQQRLTGFYQALQDQGREVSPQYVKVVAFEKRAMEATIDQLLTMETPPDALLTFSDQIAQLALKRAQQKGFRIPNDLAIIGFNNEPTDELMSPTLSSVAQPSYEMGVKAAELVFREITTSRATHERIVLESKLIRRQSA